MVRCCHVYLLKHLTQDKESDCFLPIATPDRSSTVGKALYSHTINASNVVCYLVDHVTSSLYFKI